MYSTYAEVVAMSGTVLPQATVESLIGFADREVDAYCNLHGVSADGSNSAVKSASLNLTMTYLLSRGRLDGSREVTSLEFVDKTPVDTAIQTYRDVAMKSLDQYIKSQTGAGFHTGIVGQ